MLSNQRSSRLFGAKGLTFIAIALALLMNVTAFGAGNSHFAFIDSAREFFGLQSSTAAVLSDSQATETANTVVAGPYEVTLGPGPTIAVSLPAVMNAAPSTSITVPVTVGDTTGSGIISYDMQVTYDPAVLTATSANGTGTISSNTSPPMSIIPNTSHPGHLIIAAFGSDPLSGSGTLVNLVFTVIGAPGSTTALTFEDYTDPGNQLHPACKFNDGPPDTPAASTSNGSVTLAPPTPTATATFTATSTSTATATSTATNTPSATSTSTPTSTPTATFTATATATATNTPTPPACPIVSAPTPTLNTLSGVQVTVPITTTDVAGLGYFSIDTHISYDPTILQPAAAAPFYGVSVAGSVSAGRTLTVSNQTPGILEISIFGSDPMTGGGNLFTMTFNVVGVPGQVSPINFLTFQFNEGPPGTCAVLPQNGSVTVIGGNISGRVTYGNPLAPGPAVRGVPFVDINATKTAGAGPALVTTATDTSGFYTLSGFGSGSYNIVPFKDQDEDTDGALTAFDAAKIAQYVVNLIPLNATQLYVADVTGDGTVSSFDAAQIARFVVNFSHMNVGQWRFTPASNFHNSIYSNIAGEDYSALLMGDVTGNWGYPGAYPNPRGVNGPERTTAIRAPQVSAPADSNIVIPVQVEGAVSKGVISYQFDLRYDPKVIQPQTNPVDVAGTASSGMVTTVNADTAGLLRVAVFGATPINGNAVLMNLRFTAVGDPGDTTPLTFDRLMLNEGDPRTTSVDGRVELSAAAPNQAVISGRLLTTTGQGISNARVTLTDTTGQSRSILSNGFGVYRFGNLQMGQTYTISVESRGFTFTPMSVSVSDGTVSADMIAMQ